MENTITAEHLTKLLQEVYLIIDERLRIDFERSLPFQDAMFDRWERAKRLRFGKDASIYNSSAVFGNVTVGESTWIGPNTILDGSGGHLSIGAYCSISSGVHIYTHDTVLWALSRGQSPARRQSVQIGDCVYIGSQSVISAGVTIGERCVIAANSFVNRDVPAYSVVGGTPAKVIGNVVNENNNIKIKYF